MSLDGKSVVHRDDFMRLGSGWTDIVDTMFIVSPRITKQVRVGGYRG